MNYVLLFKGGAVTTRPPKNGTINWIPEIGLSLHRVSRLNSTRHLEDLENRAIWTVRTPCWRTEHRTRRRRCKCKATREAALPGSPTQNNSCLHQLTLSNGWTSWLFCGKDQSSNVYLLSFISIEILKKLICTFLAWHTSGNALGSGFGFTMSRSIKRNTVLHNV